MTCVRPSGAADKLAVEFYRPHHAEPPRGRASAADRIILLPASLAFAPLKLARHTLFNLIGLGAPLLVALVSIPVLVHVLGPERFGLLTLIWAVTSYFGLFDLGLGRALTQQLAIALDQRLDEQIGPLSATALALMGALGVAGGLLMMVLAPWGVDQIKALPDRQEAINATLVMGLAIPFIVLTAGLRGMLEACHAFEVLNYIRLPMGIWTFGGPWLVLVLHGPDLLLITAVLALGRVLACVVHAWFAWRALPQLRGRLALQVAWFRRLAVSGGWLTLSNVVSPFMGYVDRLVIGASLSAAAVAFYATPQEIVTKLWIVPGAVTAVLFPAFAAQVAKQDGSAWVLFDRAVAALFLVLLPITVALCLFAHPLLGWWIGPDFALQSGPILQVFAIGILINCLAHVPLTWLHGAGNFRAPALLHCLELPLFVLALWLLSARMGLMGAALAWLLRMVFDSATMFALCLMQRGAWIGRRQWRGIAAAASLTALAFAGLALSSTAGRAAWLTAVTCATAMLAWQLFRSPEHCLVKP
jgi:O-antigen/teichoic acid export membrane protein